MHPDQIVPRPRKCQIRKRSLSLSGRKFINVRGPFDARLLAAVARLCEDVGQGLEWSFGECPGDLTLMTVSLQKASGTSEAYQLDCDENGLELKAESPTGIFRGLQSVHQLLREGPASLPAFTINDAPDFERRGVMLDVSRCKVPTLPTLLTLIEQLARLRYNELQLYTEHTFAFLNHEQVWQETSPYTAEDIRQIRQFCHDRFIDLVPNLNSFGHMERWLVHPEYHDLAECPQGFTHPLTGQYLNRGSTLRPNRKSLQFLGELYDEFLPNFDSPCFNIGGDEPWELGLGKSARLCAERGTTRVYMDFLKQIRNQVSKRGRQTMFWSDIILKDPAWVKEIPTDMIAMNWGYEADHPFRKECRAMAESGIPYYVCPGTSAWNALLGRTHNMTENIASAAKQGLAFNARGLLVTDWGDHGHHQYLPFSYPGLVNGASHSWNHKGSSSLNTGTAIDQIFYPDHEAGMGELLLLLGRATELVATPLRNATLFNRLLFWNMAAEPAESRQVSTATIAAARDQLRELKAMTTSLTGLDNLSLQEAGNACTMALVGLEKLLLFRGEGQSRRITERRTESAIAAHQQLWLARNRPGGLRESTAYLERSLRALQQ